MSTIIFNLLSRIVIRILYWLGFEMYIKVKIEGDKNLYKITKNGLIEEKKKNDENNTYWDFYIHIYYTFLRCHGVFI